MVLGVNPSNLNLLPKFGRSELSLTSRVCVGSCTPFIQINSLKTSECKMKKIILEPVLKWETEAGG